MKNIRPIYAIQDEKIRPFQARAVIDGIREVLAAAEVGDRIKIREFGVWRTPQWKERGGMLAPHQSVDWYVAQGRKHSTRPNQVNAQAILHAFATEPWQEAEMHYDVALISEDLYADNTNFIAGLAIPGVGTVLSVARFLGLESATQYECLKTLVMHEVSHVFGLLPRARTVAIDQRLGRHCANRCVMRQGITVPTDWITMTRDRMRHSAFCGLCQTGLKQFFA